MIYCVHFKNRNLSKQIKKNSFQFLIIARKACTLQIKFNFSCNFYDPKGHQDTIKTQQYKIYLKCLVKNFNFKVCLS